MRLKLYIFSLLFAITTVSFAQVDFTAKVSRDEIGLNENVKVEFRMNRNGDDFQRPDFKNFKIVAGPSQYMSGTFSQGKREVIKTYTYILQPEKRGNLTIGQATVKIDGKTYKTSPLKVKVTAPVNKPKDGDNQEITDVTKGIHLVTEVSNTHPYLNQGITVLYKLYVSKDAAVSNWRFQDIPKFTGFWNQDIEIKKIQIKYGSYQGDKDYRYIVLKKTVLYPQKTGELKIEPLTLNISIDTPSNRRDIFGRRLYNTVDKAMSSPARTVDVKPLPEEGRPDDFSGAVGQFKFNVSASKDSLNANESLDAKVEVSGTGNLKLFQLPKLVAPQAFEMYDPEHEEHVSTTLSGMHGRISDTYTMVPKAKGKYRIEPLSFSYFDPKSKTYKELTSRPVGIDVPNGPTAGISNNISNISSQDSLVNKQAISTVDKHFRYIKLKTNLHAINEPPFFKSKLFWTLLFMPVLLLLITVKVGDKQIEKASDVYQKRIKRADKLAKKYLSEAKKNLGNQVAYYESLERALHNYLRAKLDIQTSEISKENIGALLAKNGVSGDVKDEFISLLESCEFARYTPSSDTGMQQDYDKAAQIISKVDKQIKA